MQLADLAWLYGQIATQGAIKLFITRTASSKTSHHCPHTTTWIDGSTPGVQCTKARGLRKLPRTASPSKEPSPCTWGTGSLRRFAPIKRVRSQSRITQANNEM